MKNYSVDFEKLHKVSLWISKAHKLKHNYDTLKYNTYKEILKAYDKQDFILLQSKIVDFKHIISHKQIPLYNNIVNYSTNYIIPQLNRFKSETTIHL